MKKDKILLIGDSITDAFDTDSLLPEYNIVNKGVYGNSTTETIDLLNEEFFSSHPSVVFILIGTNDMVRDRSDDFIIENIKYIAERTLELNGAAAIYITSILPVRDIENRSNKRISRLNGLLKVLCLNENYSYFDLAEHFADEEGKLKAEYTEDGLHLTAKAYEKWTEILKQMF
jgi:lysophospholipase L1-like esterase